MSTAAELLAKTSTDDSTIVIDNNLRTIKIPSSITNLGVEADDDVTRLQFQMPRMYGTTDLSTFSIHINYMNAKNEGDIYIVTDKSVQESSITFSWLVGPHALAYKGNVKFIVCMKETDNDAVILREFNTTVATLPVLEGLEVDAQYLEGELHDVLEQVLLLLSTNADTEVLRIQEESVKQQANITNMGAEVLENIANKGTDALANIAISSSDALSNIDNKGAEVLATIPEDYQTTFGMINHADRTKADAIVCYAEGIDISVVDSSDDHIRGLTIFGKTTQAKTNGYQLFDAINLRSNTLLGATVTNNGDGSFTVSGSGTLTGTYSNHTYDYSHEETIRLLRPGTYTLKSGIVTHPYVYVQLRNASGNVLNITSSVNAIATNVVTQAMLDDPNLYLRIGFYGVEGTAIAPGTIKPILYIDGDGTWEPYSGGYASPSPEWAQELDSIGDDESGSVAIIGRNIFDAHALAVSSNTSLTVSDDGYTITAKGGTTSGWSSSIYTLPTELTKNLRGKRVYISCDSYTSVRDGSGTRSGFNVTLDTGETVYPASAGPSNLSVYTTIPINATKILFGVYTNNTGVAFDADNTVTIKGLRISVGEHINWTPYQTVQSIAINHTLRGIPVTSGGNYTDENGQQWICDEIDFERSVYVQRIGTYLVTGNESWIISRQQPAENGYTRFDGAAIQGNPPLSNDVICTHAPWTGNTNPKYGPAAWVNDPGNNNLQVRIMTTHTTVEEFVEFAVSEYAAGTPISYCYLLKNPVETPLTANEIIAFQALRTNYHNTTVTNDTGSWMKLRYNADTTIYLNRLPKATDSQVQTAVDTWLEQHFQNAEGVSF